MKTREVSSAPLEETGNDLICGSRSSTPCSASLVLNHEEVSRVSEEKSKVIKGSDEASWKEDIRKQMEDELNQRVREALETPPPECPDKGKRPGGGNHIDTYDSRIIFNFDNRDFMNTQSWRDIQARRHMQRLMRMNYVPPAPSIDFMFRDELSKSNQDEFPGVFGLESFSEGVKDFSRQNCEKFPTIRQIQRQFYTKEGFLSALRTGHFPDGSKFSRGENGTYVDKFGVVRDGNGPFWPSDVGPLFPTPRFLWFTEFLPIEPLFFHIHTKKRRILEGKFDISQHVKLNEKHIQEREDQQYPTTVDNQITPYIGKWRGVLIVYDSERSSRDRTPQPVPEGCCPNLVFESRFESGNLRQARRVGQFEYELVLKTDLNTNRHTQWYYFRVQNAIPGVVYKFRIVNLLKKDSLYNYGMRPLCYSDKNAKTKQIGWIRAGHHISYSRNILNLHCPLLMRGIAYYMLEWQMDFPHEEDTYYLAHCYPYTFTDLKEDLDALLNAPQSRECIRREVLCETRAGNSCFLVTVTDFEAEKEVQHKKDVVIVTARVHPGESQASWMMKGLLDFITSPEPTAKELRRKFIFKVVPMLNPDGVIVGNYRCSLAARDLNRNYRHPRKESFPTVWHVKNLMDKILERHNILLYCDLHGHSRKHNVFMYGNNTSTDGEQTNTTSGAKAFLQERLFPWIMSQKAPEKFSFHSCKFAIKRCKEATGRVVMWRQMRILNSFTLEATFSGTILNKTELRHFNIADFLDMGKVLCETVLDYQITQENKARQSEIVLDLTKFVTHQILEQKGLVQGTVKLPQLKKPASRDSEGMDDGCQDVPEMMMESDHLRDAIATYLENENGENGKKEKKSKKSDKSHGNLSRKDVDNMLDSASMKTMDGCLKILAQLNVRECIQESDSSDSDSESEPEMKMVEKSKKKKRKSRKQRDRDQVDRKGGGSGGSDKKPEDRMKSFSALPTITSCSEPNHDSLHCNPKKQQKLVLRRAKTSANLERYMRAQKKIEHPHFVSKYEGRRNGGIPCFAEERSLERAAKRMADMKKRTEEEKQREMAFFSYKEMMDILERDRPQTVDLNTQLQNNCDGDDEAFQITQPVMSMQVRRSLTNDDLQRRLQVALNDGTPNIAQTLVGLNVKTSYTHAENETLDTNFMRFPRRVVSMQQNYPAAATAPPQPLTPPGLKRNFRVALCDGMPTIAETLARLRPRESFLSSSESFKDMSPSVLPAAMANPREISSDEGSDTDTEVATVAIPVTARINPYQDTTPSTTLPINGLHMAGTAPNNSLSQRKYTRYMMGYENTRTGSSMLKAMPRQSSSLTPAATQSSYLTATIPTTTDEAAKLDRARTRINRTPGPLIRGIKVRGDS